MTALLAFRSHPLPSGIADVVVVALEEEHRAEPFAAADARATARRVRRLLSGVGVEARTFRGGLDLGGVEVDHLWVEVAGHVVDVAFPLFVADFVEVLRGYVTGLHPAEDLEATASGTGVDARVVGRFPARLRYVGTPLWSAR